MKRNMFDLMRVWAALTGLALVLFYFVELASGVQPSPLLPMLVTGIGGFEMFHWGQDLWLKRRGRHG